MASILVKLAVVLPISRISAPSEARSIFEALYLTDMTSYITKIVAEGLKTFTLQALKFYIPPEIHKQGNPGRTEISSIY